MIFLDNEDEDQQQKAAAYNENIEHFGALKVVTYDQGTHVENQFSKATFAAGTSKEDEIDIDDPDFEQNNWVGDTEITYQTG